MNAFENFAPPPSLAAIEWRTREIGFQMASEHGVGALLRVLAASRPGGRVLELGTGTGCAAAWLLHGIDAESRLTSVDTDAAVQQVARDVLGGDARLELICGDALAYLAGQQEESFDLVFADAIAGKYEGLELSLRVVKRGGFFVVDDLLAQADWPEGHAVRAAALAAALAERQDFYFVPMEWASGVMVGVKV